MKLVDVFTVSGLDKKRVAERVREIPGVLSVDDATVSQTRLVVQITDDNRPRIVEALRALEGVFSVEEDRPIRIDLMATVTKATDIKRDVFDQPLDFARWYSKRDLSPGKTNPHLKDWYNYPKDGAEYPENDARLGAKVIVISVDTGVDNTHAEFTGIPFERIYGGSTDLGKHGTYTASMMVGKNIGILPDCKKLIDVKIFGGNGSGTTTARNEGYEAILAWVKDPVTNGIDDDDTIIMNCSYGDWLAGHSTLLDEIMQEGIAIFAAAGNSAWNLSDGQSEYPASQLTYGAIGATDLSGRVGFFSSYGSDRVWCYAWGYQQRNAEAGGGYVYPTGTSMATPYAAACYASWAEGRYRPTSLNETEALQAQWMQEFCWQDGVFADRGQDIGSDRYVARAAYQDITLNMVVDGLEAIPRYGPAENKANASTLEVNIIYDIS